MAITRVKPAGWFTNEKLTSAQQNQVDLNTTYALDKRSGQADVLASNIGVTGGISVSSGGLFGLSSGSIAQFAGSLEYVSGSATAFKNGSNTVFDTGSNLIFASGSTVSGTIKYSASISGTSVITYLAGASNTYNASSAVAFNGNTSFDGVTVHQNGDLVSHNSGSVDYYQSGSIMINDGYGEFADLRLLNSSVVNFKNAINFVRSFTPCANLNFDIDSTTNFTLQTIDKFGQAWLDLGSIGIPNNALLKEVDIYYQPAFSHVGLPVVLPKLTLIRRAHGFSAKSILATYTEAAGSVAVYETNRTLTVAFPSGHQLDFDTYSYFISFDGEDGTNALAGLLLYPFKVKFTASSMNNY